MKGVDKTDLPMHFLFYFQEQTLMILLRDFIKSGPLITGEKQGPTLCLPLTQTASNRFSHTVPLYDDEGCKESSSLYVMYMYSHFDIFYYFKKLQVKYTEGNF